MQVIVVTLVLTKIIALFVSVYQDMMKQHQAHRHQQELQFQVYVSTMNAITVIESHCN